MRHLSQSHRCLLRRCGRQRDARIVKIMEQINDPGKRLGIKEVGLVSRAIATHEVGQELTLVPQVAEGVPQRRANIGAKPLIVGDRQIIV